MTSDPDWQLAQPHGLHHLALGASNVERLAAFYAMTFGLREVSRQRDNDGVLRSVWLALEGSVLMIERTAQRRERVQDVDAGLFLIAFRIKQSERVDFESRMAAHACPLESTTEHTSYFRDPEGNRFAVSTFPLTNPK
jgi:catechol-2,3-dioxygenase